MTSDEEYLVRLNEVRWGDDIFERDAIITELVKRGVYPKEPTPMMARDNWTIADMLRFYGAYWHQWDPGQECPSCKADLRDHNYGPPFSRKIGIYSKKVDRTTQWRCPDCSYTWERLL